MPQIAQQDYNVIKPVVSSKISTDAAAQLSLLLNFYRKTLFDCVLQGKIFNNDQDGLVTKISECIAVYTEDGLLDYLDFRFVRRQTTTLGFASFQINDNEKTLETFADIQLQSGSELFGVSLSENNELLNIGSENPISINGRYVIVTVDEDDVIVSWAYGETIPNGVINYSITPQEMDALIGIVI